MAYDVGYHYNIINQVLPSLEKSVVFSLLGHNGEERSGKSKSFHYALLDWERSTYKRTDVVVRHDDVQLGQLSQSLTMQLDYDIANNV